MKNDYLKRLEIKKGKAILDTKDVTEIEIARSLGINVNPYEISEDGELISSNGNLLLIDTNGTLELPDTVITIGEGAFAASYTLWGHFATQVPHSTQVR